MLALGSIAPKPLLEPMAALQKLIIPCLIHVIGLRKLVHRES